ncbi:MAG: hypothetical protein ACI9KE_006576, partial [Polyangiales bacterium]
AQVPQFTVIVPPGTNAEIVSVESRVVGPGEIRIGTPIIGQTAVPVQVQPVQVQPVLVQPIPSSTPQSPTQDIHIQINLRLRVETPPPAPIIHAAPAVHAPLVALPEQAPQHLQLRLEAPRRGYVLPLSLMAAGAVTTILGGMFAAFEEEYMFLPAIGTGLLLTGIVTLIIRVSRYRRARRDYDQQAQFSF